MSKNRLITTLIGFCPTCDTEVKFPFSRCPNGHWVYWDGPKEKARLLKRDHPVGFPQFGVIEFGRSYSLSTHEQPDEASAEINKLFPKQEVVVVAISADGEYYQLDGISSSGWIHHHFVSLHRRIRMLKVISGDPSVTMVSVLDKPEYPGGKDMYQVAVGSLVYAIDHVDGWTKINVDTGHWIADMWIEAQKDMKERKKK